MSFCRTLVDEWVRAGITHAVIAPGSRSTPLAVALAERVEVIVVLDERSAAYTALGLASASNRPTVLICTSGTAATHFHGTVVEASLSNVPMIVCTADRPPELQGVGAPQTIDQTRLFGSAPRWFADPGVPDAATSATWRSLAARAVCEATGPEPGPVHLNLPFREPLLETDFDENPVGRADGAPWHATLKRPGEVEPSAEILDVCARAHRPLVISGHLGSGRYELHDVPVIGDHRGPLTHSIAHWDLLVQSKTFRDDHQPDLIVFDGMSPASKNLGGWLGRLDVPQLSIRPPGRWIDPYHRIRWFAEGPLALSLAGEPGWNRSWEDAARGAAERIDAELAATDELREPDVARRLFASLPGESTLVVSSSMPIRDLEAYASPRQDVRVLANRGANGIDGVTSTAIGVALSGTPTTLLIGDLAFLHDSNALPGLAQRDIDLTIVIVDNNGGGIFSMLPQHDELPKELFEKIFATPQHVDIADLLATHRIPTASTLSTDEFDAALAATAEPAGVRAILAHTDREHNVDFRRRMPRLIASSLR